MRKKIEVSVYIEQLEELLNCMMESQFVFIDTLIGEVSITHEKAEEKIYQMIAIASEYKHRELLHVEPFIYKAYNGVTTIKDFNLLDFSGWDIVGISDHKVKELINTEIGLNPDYKED